ncbi:MAG: hypothetical protein ACJAWV_003508 [Flammeovirgaceae bacterium]|jgi:hypothetical protein
MKKTDKSKKNICLAKIERSYIPPFDFSFTGICNNSSPNFPQKIAEEGHLKKDEELLCFTFINEEIWTLLTTRRIISKEGPSPDEHSFDGIVKWDFGDFKGYSKQFYTKGFIFFEDDEVISIFIETGRASMIMINAIMTLDQIE